MADFDSIGGRPETAGDGAGRLSASELRPVDAAGREWPAELVALVGAVVDVVEEDLETELAEARREADELRARVAAMEAALIAAKSKIVAESAFNMAGYGDFPGGDPRKFTPDPECSTEDEREAHRLACAAWDRGEQTDIPAAHRWTTPEDAEAAVRDGTATIATIGPGMAHVQNVCFGLGSFTYEDDPATVALLARIDDALSGGTSALDAVVSAAVAAERARIRARVVAVIERDRGFIGTTAMVPVDSIMAAIGGAP